jgi:deoxyribonuclease-4
MKNPAFPIIGAHMSIAGGYYKAVEAAAKCEMQTVQLFTKNNNQWRAKEIGAEEVARFAASLAEHGVEQPISHASYLINLGSGNEELWEKSVAGLVVELERAQQLGIAYVVMHPGAHCERSAEEGMASIVRGLDEVHRRTPQVASQVLLETTAGQGTCLGCRFEHLAEILAEVQQSERLGVCVDTCHLFAAGYPLSERSDYEHTFGELGRIIGWERIKAFHLNDSKKPLGSRVDRHDHIGQGHIGLAAFTHLVNDARFRKIPMYLETPKGTNDDGEDWDVVNLRTLRGLVVNSAVA